MPSISRGLRSYLKKWKSRGFDDDIKRITGIIEAKSAQQLEIVVRKFDIIVLYRVDQGINV